MTDILSFTQNISGINLIDYVINYIDQNMIAYHLLKDMKFDIKSCVNGTCVVYDVTNLSDVDIQTIRSLPESQIVNLYGKTYKVECSIEDNYNKLYISILSI